MTFHVQLVAGGQVSGAMLRDVQAGDRVRLGPPIGDSLTLPPDEEWPNLLLVAGGTGLAPLLAVIDQVAARHAEVGYGPTVALYHGVRHPWNFYARPELEKYADAQWLIMRQAVSDDPSYPGLQGPVGEVAAAGGPWDGFTAMVCGSPGMVEHATAALLRSGLDAERLRSENYEHPYSQESNEPSDPASAREVIQPGAGLGN